MKTKVRNLPRFTWSGTCQSGFIRHRLSGGLVRRRVRRSSRRQRYGGGGNFSKGGSPALRDEGGFTLIELLTVLAIIMILAGLIVGGAKYAYTKAARSRAEAEIAAMETALENFKLDNGTYPITPTNRPVSTVVPEYTNSYILYRALVGGSKAYFTFKPNQLETNSTPGANGFYIRDPFGYRYCYYCSPGATDQVNQATFDLWSYGPDGVNYLPAAGWLANDDITNWKQ